MRENQKKESRKRIREIIWASPVLLLLLCSAMGCRMAEHHRPEFSDFQRALRQGYDTQAGVAAQVAVFGAAMLSDKEMKTILARTNVEALIGAGIQGRLDGTMNLQLLGRAAHIAPANPMAWAAQAYRILELLANRMGDAQEMTGEFAKAVQAWRGLQPSNSVPLYLQAAWQCLQTNVSAAKQLVEEAAGTPEFETFGVPLKLCIVRAMESVGSSKYTARIVASGNASGVVAWSKVSKAILAAAPSDQEVRGCLVLGRRVSNGGSFLEELVGDSIQTKAMERLKGSDFSADTKQIAERKERIKRASRYLDSARTGNVTEGQWVGYYDRCFATGEMEAVQALARITGDKF
jgi:hypothetical protein